MAWDEGAARGSTQVRADLYSLAHWERALSTVRARTLATDNGVACRGRLLGVRSPPGSPVVFARSVPRAHTCSRSLRPVSEATRPGQSHLIKYCLARYYAMWRH